MRPISPVTLFLLNFLLLLTTTHALQFITGPCTSDALCASGCCGFTSGKCEGAIISQERQGCGFGTPKPNNNAAKALGSTESALPPGASGSAGPTNGVYSSTRTKAKGTQFITGACASDSICASGCCGFTSGKCEGAIISQERQGCGFGDAKPNNNAAKALGSTESALPPGASCSADSSSGTTSAKAAAPAQGKQFVTGSCTSDSVCASGCCGFTSGKCEGAVVSQERQGCGFGNAAPNNNAAKALGSTESAKAPVPAPAKPTGVTAGARAAGGGVRQETGGNRDRAAMSCFRGERKAQGVMHCVPVPFVG